MNSLTPVQNPIYKIDENTEEEIELLLLNIQRIGGDNREELPSAITVGSDVEKRKSRQEEEKLNLEPQNKRQAGPSRANPTPDSFQQYWASPSPSLSQSSSSSRNSWSSPSPFTLSATPIQFLSSSDSNQPVESSTMDSVEDP